MRGLALCLLALLLAAVQADGPSTGLAFTVSRAQRLFVVENMILEETVEYTLELADIAAGSVHFQVAYPAEMYDNLVSFRAFTNKNEVSVRPVAAATAEHGLYEIDVSVAKGTGTLVITTTAAFFDMLEPTVPSALLSQSERRRAELPATVASPYVVLWQETKFSVGNHTRIALFDAHDLPTPNARGAYGVGPMHDVQAFERRGEFAVEVEARSGDQGLELTFVRDVWISRVGSRVKVRDSYEVANSAAPVDAPYERGLQDRMQRAIGSITFALPEDSEGVWVRDRIGVIYDFQQSTASGPRVVKVTPRFPLLGGFEAAFEVGHFARAPCFAVADAAARTVCRVQALPDIHPSPVVRGGLVRLHLPEGARDVALRTALPGAAVDVAHERTYLDVHGRPVVEVAIGAAFMEDLLASPVDVEFALDTASLLMKLVMPSAVAAAALLAVRLVMACAA